MADEVVKAKKNLDSCMSDEFCAVGLMYSLEWILGKLISIKDLSNKHDNMRFRECRRALHNALDLHFKSEASFGPYDE